MPVRTVTINTTEDATMFKVIAEKAKNLIGQNEDQINLDWEASLKQHDSPETYKFPFAIKGTLTNKGGKKECHLSIEWELKAKRSIGCDISEDDGQPELFDAKEEA